MTSAIGVEKVEFYIDDRLVGVDLTSPYSFAYKTISPIASEQR